MLVENLILLILTTIAIEITGWFYFTRKNNMLNKSAEFKVLLMLLIDVCMLATAMIIAGYYLNEDTLDIAALLLLLSIIGSTAAIINLYSIYLIAKTLSKNKQDISIKTNQLKKIIQAGEETSVKVSNNATSLAASASELNSSAEEISARTLEIVKKSQNQEVALKEINNMAEKIRNISKLITDISEKTNLLALNASIEAGRAGENGRGFAVVAERVQKLAEESKGSIGKTGEIIEDITKKISVVSLDSIEINSLMEEIGSATEEQTASMEEISATASLLEQEAKSLKEALSKKIYKD